MPIYELPKNYCASEQEGRAAFLAGKDLEANRYGDSLSGQDWTRGWKMERARAN